MRKTAFFAVPLILGLAAMALTGCPGKSGPLNPSAPTDTPTLAPPNTLTATPSSTPTGTATTTATSTGTATFTRTSTPADTPTSTATSTASATPSSTPTPTGTDTATNTPVNTSTATSTFTSSDTPTDTPTDTATSTATSSFTVTPTDTPTSTATSTSTGTPTPTSTVTACTNPAQYGVTTIVSTGGAIDNAMFCQPVTLTSPIYVNSMSYDSAGPFNQVRVAIYTNQVISSGYYAGQDFPYSLVTLSDYQNIGTGWVTIGVPSAYLPADPSGTIYWLVNGGVNDGGNHQFYTNGAEGWGLVHYNGSAYVTPGFPQFCDINDAGGGSVMPLVMNGCP